MGDKGNAATASVSSFAMSDISLLTWASVTI